VANLITERFDCILFDLGNTLIKQENPGVPYESLSVQLLPGVQKLHGQVKLGIVSNTQTITAAEINKKLALVGLDKYFDVIIATAELDKHKPDSAPIIAALLEINSSADRTLYVGDVENDKIAALAAGAHFAYAGPDLYVSVHQYLLHSELAFDRAINNHPVFSKPHYDSVRKEFDG
jgi:FMN phosphatase YigB (HAD superfamily)